MGSSIRFGFGQGKGGVKTTTKSFLLGLVAGGVLAVFLVAAVLVGAGYLMYRRVVQSKEFGAGLEPPPLPMQEQADYDWHVAPMMGERLHIADLKGRVVFLNFWATWCPPCVAEMPSIQGLFEKVNAEDIAIVCVSQEDHATVAAFMRKKGYSFPVYTLQGAPPRVFETEGIPATFILSPDGQIVFKHVGAAKWDDEKVVNFLNALKP